MADTLSIVNIAIVVSLSLTARDLFLRADNTQKAEKSKSPAMEGGGSVSAGPIGPNIKFLICYGWGYKKVFEEYAAAIHQRYPQISISGSNYPPGPTKQMIASVISTLKWIALGVIVFGEKVKIWDMIGMTPPSPYTWSQQNKIVSCIGVFFLSNALENALIQTGAFEVELNGMPIWSKLKSGRVPQGSELFEIIENQLQLSAPDLKNRFGVPVGDHQEDQYKDSNNDPNEQDAPEEQFNEDTVDEEEEEEERKEKKYEDEFSEIDRETEDMAE